MANDPNDPNDPKNTPTGVGTPDSVSATNKPPKRGKGVRQVNRVPIMIGVGVTTVVLGAVIYTAHERGKHHQSGKTGKETTQQVAANVPTSIFHHPREDANLRGKPKDVHGAAAPSAPANTPQPVQTAQTPMVTGGVPTEGPYARQWQKYYESRDQIEQKRQEQFLAALSNDTDATKNGSNSNSASGASGSSGDNGTSGDNRPVDSDYLAAYRTGARNALEVKEGTVIPASLIGGINSDVAGMIKAQVRQNVYDSATGETILIPQGSYVLGEFNRTVSYGQSRIDVAFTRIIFPDQSSIDLGDMEGADMAGNAGFEDQVNNHWWKMMSSAILAAAFGAGVQLSQNTNSLTGGGSSYSGYSAQQIIAAQLGQQMGEFGMEIARRGMNIPPTITIRPGYIFNVMVKKDMILPAYQDRWGNGNVHQVSAED